MLLRHSTTSPFVRKVRLAAAVLGQPLTLEVADTLDSADTLRTQNPLGKLPTLVTDAGETLFDSRVILAYLDHLAGGGKIIPTDPAARFAALRLEALADGIMDAGVLVLYESRWRAEEHHEPRWLEHQAQKIARGLAALEGHTPAPEPFTVGTIALACALGFLDYRFAGRWRGLHPKLVEFQEAFAAACPSFEETKPFTP